MDRQTTLRGVLALLILVSAALFAVGTALERHHVEATHHEATVPTSAETSGESGTETHPAESSPTTVQSSGSTESVGGFNLESPWLIAAAVLASIALALAAWRSRALTLLLLIAAFGLILAVLDLREVVHQAHEGRASLVALSAIVLTLHVGVVAVAVAVRRTERERVVVRD